MRRALWLCPLLFFACDSDTNEPDIVTQLTLMRVAPEDFLGTLPCQDGGVASYQARLIDVTDGLDDAFELPASHLASCNADTLFQHVEEGRRYIAKIAAFDQSGLEPQNPGSVIVVDSDGSVVTAKWSTTCFGDDRLDYSAFGDGGASAGGAGGAGSDSVELGTLAQYKTTNTIRGCVPLESGEAETSLKFDVESLLLGLECGVGSGKISSFSVSGDAVETEGAGGAAGGAGGAGTSGHQRTECGEELILDGLAGGQELNFTLEAFETDAVTPTYTTHCIGKPIQGVITAATCDPIAKL